MAKWKCEICGNEFDNFHAQGFDNKIYCPLCYFKKENQELKQKYENAVVDYEITMSDKTELEKFELTFKEIITMIYEEYNQKTFTSLYLSDKQTQYEKIAWDSLFRYVKYNILHYDKDQLLEPKIIQKLKELQNGRILGNNKQVALCRYSFDDILLTFKFCYFDIQKYTQSKRFENNVKKFNYICAIVRDNINTVIERKKIKQEANERLLKSNDFGYINTNKAEYVKKTEECLPELESLW